MVKYIIKRKLGDTLSKAFGVWTASDIEVVYDDFGRDMWGIKWKSSKETGREFKDIDSAEEFANQLLKAVAFAKSHKDNINDSRLKDSPESDLVSEIKRAYPQSRISVTNEKMSRYICTVIRVTNLPGLDGGEDNYGMRDRYEKFSKHLINKYGFTFGRSDHDSLLYVGDNEVYLRLYRRI